jgi:hypothetical protein
MAVESKRMAGPMQGRGYGQPYDVPGTGAVMLELAVQARSKAYRDEGRGGGPALGKLQAAAHGMARARAGYDEYRRMVAEDWHPHAIPHINVVKIEQRRDQARQDVALPAQEAQAVAADWLFQAKQAALAHRPCLSLTQREVARARLAEYRPAEWPADRVTAQRIRIATAAISTSDKALADEVLFSPSLDTIAAVARLPEGTFDRQDKVGQRADAAVWEAERWRLMHEFMDGAAPEAARDIETWRMVDHDVRELSGLINHEAQKMLHGEAW